MGSGDRHRDLVGRDVPHHGPRSCTAGSELPGTSVSLHSRELGASEIRRGEEVSRTERPYELELEMIRADGNLVWTNARGEVLRDANGKIIKLRGTLQDIAERKQAEAALQKAVEEVSQLKNKLEEENIYLREEIKLAHNFDEIVGRSDATKYVLFKIEQVAPTDSTVLITGETGTGKELVARAIHSASLRKDRPLVRVNCAALSPTLVESELFGHEKGAFTGATGRKIGRFELANGATIFLDEIGELPLELQAKLLRVIQEGEFERLGSSKTIKVDARIIAATNRNLKIAVEQGSFREDLWYRLNVFPITVPPLRDRKEDIPGLVEHFVKRFSQKVGRRISSISPASMRILQDYAWPGNVRELANVLERAVINTNGTVLRVVDHFEKPQVAELTQSDKTLEEMEKEYIIRILDNTGWRIEGHKGAAKNTGTQSQYAAHPHGQTGNPKGRSKPDYGLSRQVSFRNVNQQPGPRVDRVSIQQSLLNSGFVVTMTPTNRHETTLPFSIVSLS